MTWEPVYESEENWLVHKYALSTGNIMRFMAQDVRKERTGVHAKLAISMNWITLAWSNLNIERDEDRVRLCNSAYKHLDGNDHDLDRIELPSNSFKHALDIFCLGLWDEVVGQDLGGMMAGDPETPPAKRLLGDYVLQEGGTIGFGPPGGGKSYTALAMNVSCAWGVEAIWTVHDAWPGLYINVERPAHSMASRLALVNRALGLAPETELAFLNARGRSLSDIYEAAKRTISQYGCKWATYDSISRAGFGSLTQDENANRIMDMLNALVPTWFAIAHSPRADDTHAFGSQMFDAAADLTLQMKAQTASNGYSTGIGMQGIKANDIRLPKLAVHVLEWDEVGLSGIRRAKRGEFAELEAGERRTREEEAKSYLLSIGEATAGDMATALGWGRSRVSELLNAARWTRKEKRGKEVYFSVLSTEERVPNFGNT